MPVINVRQGYEDFNKLYNDICHYIAKTSHRVFTFGDIRHQRIWWLSRSSNKGWWITKNNLRDYMISLRKTHPKFVELLKTEEGRNKIFDWRK